MSEKAPAFQFFPKDFLSSENVRLMSMTERGIYITLLSHCWLEGSIPSDLKMLARMVHMKDKQFMRLWDYGPLHNCFQGLGERLVNPRLELERQKQEDYRRRASDYGRSGGRPKKGSLSEPFSEKKQEPFPNAKGLESSSSSSSFASSSSKEKEPARMDQWARDIIELYPPQGRCGWNLVERPLFDALNEWPGSVMDGWEAIKAAIEQHKRSHQWRVKGMIPRLDKWLREGLYLQQLPESAPASEQASAKTLRMLEGV